MRETNKVIAQTTMNTVDVSINNERFLTIYENKEYEIINVTVGYYHDDDLISKEMLEISGGYYEMLMSPFPAFAPGKAKNEYREEDLWYIVELIRNR